MMAKEEVRVFQCMECEAIYRAEGEHDDPAPLWECSRQDCGEIFVSDDRACPSCLSPFTRRLADEGCEECGAGELMELDEAQTAELEKPEGGA
jgi:hypothetical protein